MEIYSWKEIITKTKNDIPELRSIIQSKTDELTDLLNQNNIQDPLELRWEAYKTFKNTKKEILNILNVLDKLGYKWKENVRKTFNNWPFIWQAKINFNSPTVRRKIKITENKVKKIQKNAKVDLNELRNTYITI